MSSTEVASSQDIKVANTTATLVNLGSESFGAYEALITAVIATNIPLGVVLGNDRTLCSASIPQAAVRSIFSLGQLIATFNDNARGYHASLTDRVLDIVPTAEESGSNDMLNLKVGSFASPPSTMGRLAIRLWFAIQAVLHPEQGSAFAGSLSPAAEEIPALTLDGRTVKEILNKVVQEGHGGVWVYQSNNPSSSTTIPFQIRSYVGEKELIQRLAKCGA